MTSSYMGSTALSWRAAVCLMIFIAGCAQSTGDTIQESWAENIRLERIEPLTVLPGTTVLIRGEGFVGQLLGTTRLRFVGTATGEDGRTFPIDLQELVNIESTEYLQLELTENLFNRLCPVGVGRFDGQLTMEVAAVRSNQLHRTVPMNVSLACAYSLIPTLFSIEGGQKTLNQVLDIRADTLLLGGEEGQTKLAVEGCFLPEGSPPPCEQNGLLIDDESQVVKVRDPRTRFGGQAVLSPQFVGLTPGFLDGRARLINEHANGVRTSSAPQFFRVDLSPSRLLGVQRAGASLGGFINFDGLGLIGEQSDELTEIIFNGLFHPADGTPPTALQLNLVTDYKSGERVTYVLDEDDELGNLINLRQEWGEVDGEFQAVLSTDRERRELDPIPGAFQIQPVRQVVFVRYTNGFQDALDRFGLRELEAQVRTRILTHARSIFDGLNVEFREEEPDDYRLYAVVDVTGVDPNGIGLIGYDNTPGKDVGNLRLNDQIGGVHAQTQQDGYPGYGGVFVESFFSFSRRPPRGIEPNPGASDVFDEIFSSLRPDLSGQPVTPNEAAEFIAIDRGEECPDTTGRRKKRIQCAVFVLGNLLGGTLSHELAHSFGLAQPEGMGFHNSSDMPNHLMDSGFDRPFLERAFLSGSGPEYFCKQNYDYLASVLPTGRPDPFPGRTNCP